MSAELVIHEPRAEFVLDIELIKRTIAKGSTDDELALFVSQCKRTGLDPFAKQIHAVKRWDSGAKREVMQVQVGIDGFRLIADRTERYVPGREPVFVHDADGRLVSATAFVKVWRRDSWHEVPATAMYAEYVQTNREGEPNSMWRKMPHSQLAKCAESLALRKAFPAELSGLYTSDEMGQADTAPTVTAEVTAHVHTEADHTDVHEAADREAAERAEAERKATQKAEASSAYTAFAARASELGYSHTDKPSLIVLARFLCKTDKPGTKCLQDAIALNTQTWNLAIDDAYAELAKADVKPTADDGLTETERKANEIISEADANATRRAIEGK